MSSVESLREFVNERLTAAAEEIFGVFKKTIFEYEEEIGRQRRLLDIVWKPEIKLHRIELPQQHVCKEEEVLTDQQLCIQDRNSSLDQEDPEPPQIKEEQKELCTSQEGEQLVLKQETDTFTTHEESDHSDDQTLHINPDKTLSASEKESVVNIPVIISVVSEAHSYNQLPSHNSHVAKSQDQKGGKHRDSGSTRNAEPESKKRHRKSRSHSNNINHPNLVKIHSNTHTGKTFFQCDTCKKAFKYNSHFQRHLIIHTGEKPYSCKTCGKRFSRTSVLNAHMIIHTGEKPYSCKTCGRDFRHKNGLLAHVRKAHTSEKLYSCRTCGKGFKWNSCLTLHMASHFGGKPYTCSTCGKIFTQMSSLNAHIRIHTGEKPYSCKTCGRDFRLNRYLKVHMRTHTGEKPYSCNTCGKRYSRTSLLKAHIRIHTGEKPYSCKTCGRDFRYNSGLFVHMKRAHTGKKP